MVIKRGLDSSLGSLEGAVDSLTKVRVVGVGGGGSNAVNRMIVEDLPGIEFIAVNTDAQALVRSRAPIRLRIGEKLTRGLGAGGDHTLGMLAADESRDEIARAVEGADMIFITAGMGGGTGTGASPVIAEVAKELGVLTIAIVTRPFKFEGIYREQVAEEGVIRLGERADTIIVISNERLLSICSGNVSIDNAFKMVDDVLLRGVEGISGVVMNSGHINLDFSDVKATMSEAGHAWIAVGYGSGENRAADAARAALGNPLFEFSIEGAKRVLFNISGNDLTLSEVNDAATVIREVADPHAHVFFGLGTDPKVGRDVRLTLIATGFGEDGDLLEDEHEPDDNGDELSDAPVEDKWRSVFNWIK
ncbi:MAG TPA: cell division protein FtsZ [Dehalococcoidia bacterium]|nr:cell division protein FtsZ [Dehalococcoidia bacterium]